MHRADAQIFELRIVASSFCGRLGRSRWRESSSYLEVQRAGKKHKGVQRSRGRSCTRCRSLEWALPTGATIATSAQPETQVSSPCRSQSRLSRDSRAPTQTCRLGQPAAMWCERATSLGRRAERKREAQRERELTRRGGAAELSLVIALCCVFLREDPAPPEEEAELEAWDGPGHGNGDGHGFAPWGRDLGKRSGSSESPAERERRERREREGRAGEPARAHHPDSAQRPLGSEVRRRWSCGAAFRR